MWEGDRGLDRPCTDIDGQYIPSGKWTWSDVTIQMYECLSWQLPEELELIFLTRHTKCIGNYFEELGGGQFKIKVNFSSVLIYTHMYVYTCIHIYTHIHT